MDSISDSDSEDVGSIPTGTTLKKEGKVPYFNARPTELDRVICVEYYQYIS